MITSINQIADAMRAEKLRDESDIWNLKSLYTQLSSRWHWEIDKILREKSYEINHFWHIESRIAEAYDNMKRFVDNLPDGSPERIKRFFSWSNPWFSPATRDMIYDLAVHERSKKI